MAKPTFATIAAARKQQAEDSAPSAPITPPLSNSPSINPSPIQLPISHAASSSWNPIKSPTNLKIKQETLQQKNAPSQEKWRNLGSIWNDNSVATSVLAPPQGDNDDQYFQTLAEEDHKRRLSLRPENLMPSYPTQRKFSLGITSENEMYESLKGDETDIFSSGYAIPKSRSRSKSSSAIFGHLTSFDELALHENDEMWTNRQHHAALDVPEVRRRSITQPGANSSMWEAIHDENQQLLPTAGQSAGSFPRRFSAIHNNYLSDAFSSPADLQTPMDMRRRHSLAGPLYAAGSNNHYLTGAMEGMSLQSEAAPVYTGINDYFENTEHRTKAWVEAGKNLQQQSHSEHWPLYAVEFKAGRHDFFFVDDSNLQVRKGDLVIVEADRGKDLGKVIHDNIQDLQQLQHYQANHIDLLAETQFGKDVQPKRIFRLASQAEVTLLVGKSQDEAKAMSICQSKIRQKKLPMEVVDLEYQWDRRKLTLYFVAERRIDFRELVRDLFKIYKTRIWM